MPHILIIDDDVELSDLLKEVLSFENCVVSSAYDGLSGLEAMDDSVDLVLLDVMMPKLNGFETLKQLREKWDVPVLMLTAKGEEIDRVVGLELGADDYLPKPFSERELLARIRAILRRTQGIKGNQQNDFVVYRDIKLYPGRLEAYCNGDLLDLTSTEFALLHYFLLHPGCVLTKEVLSLDVLGKRLATFDRAVDMHVSNLRKKLPDWPNGKPRIKTLRGRGYLLVEGD
ncbi:DNA-binding response regulator [Marinomonas primoryensis]|jgi:two-component system response regulator CpxR|uniref:Response regulator n=1 Tax=Marinomonas primoryensis TaxID=178399 RepID=A0A2Z4PT11_9GAMM|nr:response regulator [Marinomonas primoryensis]AWY00289.1 DNA-binding response regulator [Marinomonas primoryensis]QKK81211.1 OmpR/ PhoB superfamily protein [Marinomonas primoryensis]|tara:strand:+ start:5909 stop:6595 length:687 start_codon:yes stop_codon:yes gene_type:complete